MEHFCVEVGVVDTLKRLLEQEDRNHDYKITVEDLGPKCFVLESVEGDKQTIRGTYPLSNLLQILAKAYQEELKTVLIKSEEITKNPVELLRNRIQNEYWDALRRTLDEKGLVLLLEDPKTDSKTSHRLYVPATDPLAYRYFTSLSRKHPYLKLEIHSLPFSFNETLFKKLDEKPGLLSLAIDPSTGKGIPFVVPGGRFNEMYGWDSYFMLLGLLEDNKLELAKGLIDNCAYQIEHYHGILNANRTYYLSRSNPPFFTSMIRSFVEHRKAKEEISRWLRLAILDYEQVWSHPSRITSTGLNRYYGGNLGVPLEVEAGHFRSLFRAKAYEKKMDPLILEKEYREGKILDSDLEEYFIHDRSMRESGHDTTNRLVGVSAFLNPVDLNSLLYKVEMDIAYLIEVYFSGAFTCSKGMIISAADWYSQAESRKLKIQQLLWSEKRGLFFDYHFKNQKQQDFESVTSMYPLFAGLCSVEQAKILINNIIRLFEAPGGLLSTTKKSRGFVSSQNPQRQWDYPFGWAPHQILFWKGAIQYGELKTAQRLAYKWLYMITKEAMDYAGVIVEKYNVIQRSHKARAEYGNVGIDFQVYPKEGFGWVNASYQLGWSILSPSLQKSLKKMQAPEDIFK